MNSLYQKMIALLGENKVFINDAIGADFCHDEYPGGDYKPEAVVEASSTEEVSAVLKLCHEAGVFVTIRGAGTGQAGGCVPIHGGITLSVKGMNKILEYNEKEHTLCVQPGVLLQDVKAEANKHGMYYPPDPGEQTATIGGNASTNAYGPCAVKYGQTKDYIVDAVIVLSDGSVETLRSKEEFSVVVGGEGTFAVITELTLKLIEKPKADVILLFPFLDSQTCVNAAMTILKEGFQPATLEYLDTDLVEFSGKVTENPVFPIEMDGERLAATLMVTLEGESDDDVMEKMEAVAELAESLECLDILAGDTTSMKREFWAAHGAFHTSMESGAKCSRVLNIDVPTQEVSGMIEYVKNLGEEKGLKVMVLSHVGSGGMHIHAVSDCDKEVFQPVIKEFTDAVYAKCAQVGGDITGEFGNGYSKVPYLTEETKAKHAAAKALLDPKGILNPGKVSG